ncbi:hypothetical protein SapgrDRAFT_2423 [Saprospira grandis DSM 2844]|uniref:Uncharacterized protein n=1 Tax=Saprospira grandis DSM 2844 TaxID=694433 RepID=J1I6R1_9BACT|nr:hypothetical protein SapgrDRAFT_2423 [Saprospira grandis DSM 2844]
MARTYSFYPLDAIFLGPAALGGRALSGLASLLGPSPLSAARSGLRPPLQAPRPSSPTAQLQAASRLQASQARAKRARPAAGGGHNMLCT